MLAKIRYVPLRPNSASKDNPNGADINIDIPTVENITDTTILRYFSKKKPTAHTWPDIDSENPMPEKNNYIYDIQKTPFSAKGTNS